MKAAIKNSKLALATLFFFIAMLAPSFPAFSAPPSADCHCPSPTVTKTSQGSNSVSFSWDAVTGAIGYRVWYVREEDNFTSQAFTTGATSANYSNLPAGTYRFHFLTVCDGDTSQIIITDDLIML